jgi:hypothetical protein
VEHDMEVEHEMEVEHDTNLLNQIGSSSRDWCRWDSVEYQGV